MNEMKRLVYLAGVLAACGIIAGCSSTKSQAPVKKGTLTLLSDRGVMPPPYRSPLVAPISNEVAPASAPTQVDVSQSEEPQSFAGDGEPVFVAADGEKPEATTTQYQSDYASPADASPKTTAAEPPPTKSNVPKRTYKVVKGDTFSGIGYMYNVPWQDIAAENNMSGTSILPEGKILVLPESAAETPRPRQARKNSSKTNVQSSAKNTSGTGNAVKTAATTKTAGTAKTLPSDGIYTVVAGDSLWTICHRYGLKMEDVKALNPTVNFQNLQIGQKVKLTAGKATKGVDAPKPVAKKDAPKPPTLPNVTQTTEQDDEDAPAPPTPPAQPATDEAAPAPPAPPAQDATEQAAPAAETPAQPKVTMPTLPKFDEFAPNQQPANNAEEPPLP